MMYLPSIGIGNCAAVAASGVHTFSMVTNVAINATTAIHGTMARKARACERPMTAHRTAPAKSTASGAISMNLGPRLVDAARMAGVMVFTGWLPCQRQAQRWSWWRCHPRWRVGDWQGRAR